MNRFAIVLVAALIGSCANDTAPSDSDLVPTACLRTGAECGVTVDAFGRAVHCGGCAEGDVCVFNQCSACQPATCEQAGAACGEVPDGCGGVLDCGVCPASSTIRSLATHARAIAADPVTERVYASLPSVAGPDGNSIAVIDTASASVVDTIFVGSEPGAIALSASRRYLWVGLDGASELVELDLETREAVLSIVLPEGMRGGRRNAAVILPSPVDDAVVIVGIEDLDFSGRVTALAAYRDGMPIGDPLALSQAGTAWTIDPDGSRVYASSTYPGDGIATYFVGADGITGPSIGPDVFSRAVSSMVAAEGRLHCGDGSIYDLEQKRIVGTLPASTGFIDHDPGKHRSYFFPWELSTFDRDKRAKIVAFDTETLDPVASIDLGLPERDLKTKSLVRYASDGLAVLMSDWFGDEGELLLVQSSGL